VDGLSRPVRSSSITLRDVAGVAGVHYSTASKALDPTKERLVSLATRARVREAAATLGYRPHLFARGLRRGKTGMIGLILPDIGNPYIPPLVRSLREVLEADEMTAIIVETEDDDRRLVRALDSLAALRVDGVIAGCARIGDEDRLEEFDREVSPVVLAIRRLPGSRLSCVSADDVAGGELAARYLVGLGHLRLAQLEGPADVQPFLDRSEGFSRALSAQRRCELLEVGERAAHPSYDEGVRLAHALIGRGEPMPTAIFAHNDTMALGAIDALHSSGLRCPQDVSVLGFNDSPLAERCTPALTTIRTPSGEIGRRAAAAVLARIRGEEVGDQLTTPALVPRRSTARALAVGPARPPSSSRRKVTVR